MKLYRNTEELLLLKVQFPFFYIGLPKKLFPGCGLKFWSSLLNISISLIQSPCPGGGPLFGPIFGGGGPPPGPIMGPSDIISKPTKCIIYFKIKQKYLLIEKIRWKKIDFTCWWHIWIGWSIKATIRWNRALVVWHRGRIVTLKKKIYYNIFHIYYRYLFA